MYSVSTKNKANYFLAQRHQTTTKCYNYWHCESAYDCVFHLTCIMHILYLVKGSDKLHFGSKQNSQTVKPQIQN